MIEYVKRDEQHEQVANAPVDHVANTGQNGHDNQGAFDGIETRPVRRCGGCACVGTLAMFVVVRIHAGPFHKCYGKYRVHHIGHKQGRKQGQNEREGQKLHKFTHNSRPEKQRKKRRDSRQCSRQYRCKYLARCYFYGLFDVPVFVLIKESVGVFDNHNGIIHHQP